MAVTITHKRGDTYRLKGVYSDANGVPINLTGYTIESHIRDKDDNLVHSFAVASRIDAEGSFEMVPADTSLWPLSKLAWDIQYTFNGIVQSGETNYIQMVKDVTY